MICFALRMQDYTGYSTNTCFSLSLYIHMYIYIYIISTDVVAVHTCRRLQATFSKLRLYSAEMLGMLTTVQLGLEFPSFGVYLADLHYTNTHLFIHIFSLYIYISMYIFINTCIYRYIHIYIHIKRERSLYAHMNMY